MDPGAIYRPLSIATSVENDWGRWGPFWRSPLTLALETIDFLKKSANHKNLDLGPSWEVFFPLPSKKSKNWRFFWGHGALYAAIRDRRDRRQFEQFFRKFALRGRKFCRFFCDFFRTFRTAFESFPSTFRKVRKPAETCRKCSETAILAGHVGYPSNSLKVPKNRFFRDFRDFPDFCRFLQIFAILSSETCPEMCDSWTPKSRVFGIQNLNFPELSEHDSEGSNRCVNIWLRWIELDIFLSFLCAKKLKKYISLASTT